MNIKNPEDSKPHFARIVIELEGEEQAKMVCSAVVPELNVLGYDRTEATIIVEQRSLILEIKAKDLVGLRAAIGSSLRWLAVSIQTLEKFPLS